MTLITELPLSEKLQKLLVKAILVSCIVITVSQCLLHFLTFRYEFTATAKKTADIVARNIEPPLNFEDVGAAELFLKSLAADNTLEYAVVYDANGNAFASYSNQTNPVPKSAEHIPYGIQFAGRTIHEKIVSSDNLNPGKVLGAIYLKYSFWPLYLEMFINIAILACAFLTAYVAGRLLIRSNIRTITDPIEKLTDMATIIANEKQYNIRIDVETRDEIGKLTESFNEMLAQINVRDTALLAIKADLENQVEQRTRELSAQAYELKKLNEDFQNFIAVLRHDLRTPMLSLTIYLSEVQEKVSELTELVEKYESILPKADKILLKNSWEAIGYGIETNRKAISSINRMFNSLMDITAISKMELSMKEVDVVSMVRQVIEAFTEKAEKNGVLVRIGELPPTIYTDSDKMSEVLSCLFDNAIKYSAQSPEKIVTIYGEENTESWKLHLTDTGPGIPDYMKDKIFDLFRRGDHEHVEAGAGVGLAYARTLSNRLSATIEVCSEKGEGATFSVIIRKGFR